LYNKQDKPTELGLESEKQVLEDVIGPEVLNIEVEEAIRTLSRRKAEGMDGIPHIFAWRGEGKICRIMSVDIQRRSMTKGLFTKRNDSY